MPVGGTPNPVVRRGRPVGERRRARAAVLESAPLAARGWSRGLLLAVLVWVLELGAAAIARAEDETRDATPPESEDLWTRSHVIPDWGGYRASLDQQGVAFEIVYTGDFMSNPVGGLDQESEYLGNLDMTLTWQTEALLGVDLGTFFVYGLWNHGNGPSRHVGDTQGVDNIEAPSTIKLYEGWWQRSLFDGKASILLGLYDVNSEFYVLESAEVFIHSSFGIGAELGTTGINGPSIFPTTSLGARVKVEPVRGYVLQAAVLDGVPGDPRRPNGTHVRFGDDDGVFFIAEASYHRDRRRHEEGEGASRAAQRRRVGRGWDQPPVVGRIALGTWLYSDRLPHVERVDASGDPVTTHGRPGLYLVAEYDAARLDPLDATGLSVFLQLGWADGDVAQFEGYTGAGFKYTGLIPGRPADELGLGVAVGYNGSAFDRAARDAGDRPAVAEIAVEWTYRAWLTPWLSLQADLQYVANPGGLKNRSDALVAGLRYTLSF